MSNVAKFMEAEFFSNVRSVLDLSDWQVQVS